MSGRLFYDTTDDLPRADQKRFRRPKKPLDLSHWRYPFGYRLKLIGTDGSFQYRDAADYPECVAMRTQALRTGRYVVAWIEMKST